MNPRSRVDVAVIGGGLIGLATAYVLLRKAPERRLILLEKEQAVALHQTGRNSGVVHSGIYYAPGSWKAQLCRRARDALFVFAERHGVQVRRLGKLIVAVDHSELAYMRNLYSRGVANGVKGLREITAEEIRDIEPNVTGLAALHVPETAVIDFSEVATHLAAEVQRAGGNVMFASPLREVRRTPAGWWLGTDAEELEARVVVTCTGLQSDRIARMMGAPTNYRIIPFEGKYRRLAPGASRLVRGLVYPVPRPDLPFLGVHFTRRANDEVWVGPSAVFARGREAYGREWSARDIASALSYPGFWKLLKTYWRIALAEELQDKSIRSFLGECRKYVPELSQEDLMPGSSGIRAQAVGPKGNLIEDFKLLRRPGLVHVANAPSPAATSSLAIGEILADQALAELG
jgi:(S)-2-hydroxyglutarate dehydrogenase